jgi:uncharacterized protein (DUF4415 family)
MNEKRSKTHSTGSSRRRGQIDWPYLDGVAGDEIAVAVAGDREAAPLDIGWPEAILIVPPRKTAVSIEINRDVPDHFKNEGPGCQRRINAVLRSHVEQKQKRGKPA